MGSRRLSGGEFWPGVLIEGDKISRRSVLYRLLLVRGELRLQLVGNGFGDLALDGEDIGHIAIVSLRPDMRVFRASISCAFTRTFAARCTLPSSK